MLTNDVVSFEQPAPDIKDKYGTFYFQPGQPYYQEDYQSGMGSTQQMLMPEMVSF